MSLPSTSSKLVYYNLRDAKYTHTHNGKHPHIIVHLINKIQYMTKKNSAHNLLNVNLLAKRKANNVHAMNQCIHSIKKSFK